MCVRAREGERERDAREREKERRVRVKIGGTSKFSAYVFTLKAHFELMTNLLSPEIPFASKIYEIVKFSLLIES